MCGENGVFAYGNGCEGEEGHGDDGDAFHAFAVVFEDVAVVLGDDVEGLEASQHSLLVSCAICALSLLG